MNKTLILVRHGKAESRGQSESDFQRQLTEEGRSDSFRMANLLLKSGIKPDLIMGSMASRAAQTAGIFAGVLNTRSENINLSRKFYYCSAKILMNEIFGLPSAVQSVMVVAHNPGISELARALSSGRIFYMDNTELIILEYDIDHWHQFDEQEPVVFKDHRVTDTPVK